MNTLATSPTALGADGFAPSSPGSHAGTGLRPSFIVGALAALALLVMLGLQNLRPTAPAPATAAAGEFSAQRALPRLKTIAAEPHPTGTPANARVRAYLMSELQALGYAPQLQSTLGSSTEGSAAGHIHNIVLRVPGQARTVPGKALMLTAHYDSVPTGNGAADNGASVAAILETLRALKASAPLKNDLRALS